VSWNSTSVAQLCEGIPGVKRTGREVEYHSSHYPELYRLLRVLLALAGSAAANPHSYD